MLWIQLRLVEPKRPNWSWKGVEAQLGPQRNREPSPVELGWNCHQILKPGISTTFQKISTSQNKDYVVNQHINILNLHFLIAIFK